MDPMKTGRLIAALRRERRLTQRQLAERLHVSDKAVSKWERGLGCPEVSLLPALAGCLDVDLACLLAGSLDSGQNWEGNMKRTRFYVCPTCGGLLIATAEAACVCCGRRLAPLQPQVPQASHCITVERLEDELFLTSNHPMEKAHYIAFAAVLTGETLLLRRMYPEWDLQLRLPALARGQLLWYCTQHGLFMQAL